jgi:hypothetical protein
MNQFFDIAGSLLYMALSVVLLPVFILFDMVMGAWMLAKWTRKNGKTLMVRFSHHQAHYQLRFKKAVVLSRAKLNNTVH